MSKRFVNMSIKVLTAVGTATSRPKRSETEHLVEPIPPDGSQKKGLLQNTPMKKTTSTIPKGVG